jgi:GNAT superfamily N-acetyltransferase
MGKKNFLNYIFLRNQHYRNQYQLVASSDNKIIGTLQISFIPGLARLGAWRGQIEAVRIHSSHRSEGLGRKMFEHAIEICRKHGCFLVQLTTDKTRKDAHRFYDQLGFKATHEGYKLSLE